MRMRTTADLESALAPHLTLVRLRAEYALVRRLNAGYGFADARIPAEVYLRDGQARERMSRDSLRPQGTHLAQASEITEAIAKAEEAAARCESGLGTLAQRLGLDRAEQALLNVAIAYELDADIRDLCHALAWRRPSALYGDVCQEIAPELSRSSIVLRVLHPSSVLRRARLVDLINPLGSARETKVACTVAASRRVLDWLLGDERIAAPLDTFMTILYPEREGAIYIDDNAARDVDRAIGLVSGRADAVKERHGAGGEGLPLILIQGPVGAGKQAVAQVLAARLERSLAIVSLSGAMAAQSRERDLGILEQALGEARMRNAVVYVSGIDSLHDSVHDSPSPDDTIGRQAMKRAIERYGDIVVLATSERGMPSLPVARPFHLIRMAGATLENRRKAWTAALTALRALRSEEAIANSNGSNDSGNASDSNDSELDDQVADELASRYVVGPGVISDVIRDAVAFARSTGERVSRTSIEDAVARRLTLRLGSFGTLITRKARLDEMVLPEDVVETLDDMMAMVRERTQILERWGYGEHLGLSRGVSALFSGEPGTGKTMAASVIAGALGLELIRIDLSAVTSKWVGETEKHLATIFDEAQSANSMLLFDEADSLFGKRTELKSAQDRYANLEVNYVLQRMESFDGISILTTNFESAIDPAFLRRLNFRVRFPEPEETEREELWRRLLPPNTNIADRVDFRTLAERFQMTGGHIRNAIVRAAVVAAREGRAMEPNDLLTGAHHEYAEMGKVMPSLLS